MRVLRGPWSNVPRAARYVRILRNDLQGSVVGVFPERGNEANRGFLTSSKLRFTEPPPPSIEFVLAGVARLLKTLKLRLKPATSKCIERSRHFQSQALLTMISGRRFGTLVLATAAAELGLPLPLSN